MQRSLKNIILNCKRLQMEIRWSTLQDTLFSVHYRTLCFQYTTRHSVFSTLQDTVFSTLQDTLFSVHYRTLCFQYTTRHCFQYTTGHCFQYTTGHSVLSKLQDTLFSVLYKTHCFQYTTRHSVFSTLQDTLFSVHYRALCFQYTTGHSVFSIISAGMGLSSRSAFSFVQIFIFQGTRRTYFAVTLSCIDVLITTNTAGLCTFWDDEVLFAQFISTLPFP